MTRFPVPFHPVRTAVVVAGAGLLLGGCSFDLADAKTRTATADAVVAEAVTAVEVPDARRGSIEVTAGSGPGVTVRRTVHYRGSAPRPGQRVEGGRLVFSDGCPAGAGACWVDYRLEVPAAATVRLTSSSGRISATGVAAAELMSSSGAIRAEGITGPLKVRTASGSVTGAGLSGPSAEAAASSGDVALEFAKPPASVAARTSSGDVTLRVPRAPYRVETRTASGKQDASLASDPAAAARIAVHTSSGDIRLAAAD
ncbi:DUF4097 family beta strand repeat-containing protein [Streptomyces sp. NPDC032472]|uniref:DUF4097 family beta strand repeat-containing protein n=1 Tax=Streptomyces sp. NPDC032472 TaxID=3155018 RepID=UPI0033C2D629